MPRNKISKAGVLLAVSNIEKAKNFYETVLEQKIVADDGAYIVEFESGFGLQADYAGLVEGGKEPFSKYPTGAKLVMKTKSNNYQLAFEVEDLDYWVEKIKSANDVEILHDIAEYSWGQRVIRFYDYDGHIVELGEELKVVIKRFLAQGLTLEEIAERFGDSVEMVQQILDGE